MNGLELARHLRAHPRGEHAVLVALTGYGRDIDKQRAEQAGFDRHMLKPVDMDAVSAMLAALSAAIHAD